ncbi:unnamed protein product [Protopolystoma xenopodis]|uniref:Uncharacterized protein n=1 Tax=Protopolystoma xenopodis TaxID=117903 RepID=A0A448XRN3_9PLAT|nr:unnamed protein product [Protopolystoma xenopodis]
MSVGPALKGSGVKNHGSRALKWEMWAEKGRKTRSGGGGCYGVYTLRPIGQEKKT